MPNLYNYIFDEVTQTYQFTAKNHILYRVAFVVAETLDTISSSEQPITNIYQIVIEKINKEPEPFDRLVGKTIEHIITGFFLNIKNSMIYVCSDDQGKGSIRFHVFERWYQHSLYKITLLRSIMCCPSIFRTRPVNYRRPFYTTGITWMLRTP